MSFLALLDRRFAVYRRTAQVLDSATLSGATAADRTPTGAYHVEVEVTYAGAGALGSVAVSGTSGGGAASQSLSFAGLLSSSGTARLSTTLRFDAGTAVTLTPSGWGADPVVVARAVTSDGSPLSLLYLLQSAWPGRIDRDRGRWALPIPGSAQEERTTLFFAYSTTYVPREGDEYVESLDGRRWRADSAPLLDDSVQAHHWEVSVQREER